MEVNSSNAATSNGHSLPRSSMLETCLDGLDIERVQPDTITASGLYDKACTGIELAKKAHARASAIARSYDDASTDVPGDASSSQDGVPGGTGSSSSADPASSPRRLPNRSKRLQDRATKCAERAASFRANGRLALASAQIQRCRKYAEDAVVMDDENVGARFLLLGCLMYQGQFDSAKTEALQAQKSLCEDQRRFMADPVLHLVLAHLSRRLGEADQAAAFLREAAAAYPEHPQPCLALAELLNGGGRLQAGAEMATEAIVRDNEPGCPERLNPAEQAAAAHLSLDILVEEDEEDEDALFAEVSDDEESRVQYCSTKQASPGVLLREESLCTAASDSTTVPDVGRSYAWSDPYATNYQPVRKLFEESAASSPAVRLRSRAFGPRPPSPQAQARHDLKKGLLPSGPSSRVRQDLLIHEHVPREPATSVWSCRGALGGHFEYGC